LFDQILSWMLIVLPVAFGFILILVPGKAEDEQKHMRWRYILGGCLIAFGVLTWVQQSRAIKVAAKDRENAITETSGKVASATSASVTKAVGEQYQTMITDLTNQIQALKQQLAAQAKDVGIIKGSDIVTGKKPIQVEVTNGSAPLAGNPKEKQRREEIRTQLGTFLTENRNLMNGCLASPSTCEDLANQWYGQAQVYIKTKLEPSYLSRFVNASGLSLIYGNADEKTNGIVNNLNFKATALEQFIRELLN
jgi:hypothetical protein